MKTLSKPIICCGFTPCVQRIIEFKKVEKGAVNRAGKVTLGIGGKGANTARMVKQLGGNSVLLEFVGGSNGQLLEQMLDAEEIEYRHLVVQGETRVCQTLVEEGNPETTELVEEMPAVSTEDWAGMLDLIGSLNLGNAVVAISGKLPAGAPVNGYAEICRMVHEKSGRVILDVQAEPLMLALSHKPHMVKINDTELFQATGMNDVLAACREIINRGAQSLFITRGSRSAFYVDSQRAYEIHPLQIEAINPIGSGDAVTAGMANALHAGTELEEMIRQGMACGAANALNLLSGFLKPDDVERLKADVKIESL